MTQNTAQEGGVSGDGGDMKQQVELCLSETYIALNRVLQNNVTKVGPKAMSVPLSVIAGVLPTPNSKAPDQVLVREAVKELEGLECSGDDMVISSGKSAPNSNRMWEIRRKLVIVDRLPAGATAGSIRELLSGCGRIVFATLCHQRLAASYVKGAHHSHTVHAVVQFATVQGAVQAVETMNFSWRGGPRVTHAMTDFRAPSPLRTHNQNVTKEHAPSTDSSSADGSMNDIDDQLESCRSHGQNCKSFDACGLHGDAQKKPRKKKAKKGKTKAESDGNSSSAAKRDYASWAAATPENRAHAPRFVNSRSAISAPGAPVIDALHLRMPRGPDGTRGFTMGRGRLLPVPVHA